MVTLRAGALIPAAHLADQIRRIGVGVAIAGAFEAAPAGSARIWQGTCRLAARARAFLARFVPWRRSQPVGVSGLAAGSMVLPKPHIAGTGHVWNPNGPAWEQTVSCTSYTGSSTAG